MKLSIQPPKVLPPSPQFRPSLRSQNTLGVGAFKPKRGRLNSNPNPEVFDEKRVDISGMSEMPAYDYGINYESTSTAPSLKPMMPIRSKTIRSAKINRNSRGKITKQEIKQMFRGIFTGAHKNGNIESPFGKNLGSRVPEQLQSKMDYFYTAYNTEKYIQPYMVFDDKLNETSDSNKEKVFYKTAQNKWGNISKNVFDKNSEHFRHFLNAVNTDMYSDLIELGTKYCSKIIKPKSVNGRRTSVLSSASQSEKHISKGIKMLKDIVRDKILNKRQGRTNEDCKATGTDADTRHEILSSLICISRENSKFRKDLDKGNETFRINDNTKTVKAREKLSFTPFSKFLKAGDIKQSMRNFSSTKVTKSVEGRQTRRRKSLFKFLHSEKQIAPLKDKNIKCHGCLTNRIRVRKSRAKAKSIVSVRPKVDAKARRSLNIVMRKRPVPKLSYKPQLKVITDKNVLLTMDKDTRGSNDSHEESCKSIDSVSVGTFQS